MQCVITVKMAMAFSGPELSMPMFVFEPKDTAGQRWPRWLGRFDNYLKATGIYTAERQRAMLLHMIGR